ncbi:hypothetical protein VEE15_25110 [Escherichia coli]|nr:hypothetical protein VEE15_25110 [Escherichia coli]
MGVIEFLFALAQDMILAAIPAVGFAMVFNVPVRGITLVCAAWRDWSWFTNDLNDQRAEY